ncbi:MAG: aminotransferase class V-fold PLP-dependent enzyme [Microcoleus sp. SIO2G3]|nr:aminotransferase class V-fold PLP-dependent enzyme [Microcoleus sp. SIO2G3]
MALDAALGLLEDVGIEAIERRILELTDYQHRQLRDKDIEIVSTTDCKHRSGITSIAIPNPQAIAQALKTRKVIASARGEGLRVSLHFYNNYDDVDQLLRELVAISLGKL